MQNKFKDVKTQFKNTIIVMELTENRNNYRGYPQW